MAKASLFGVGLFLAAFSGGAYAAEDGYTYLDQVCMAKKERECVKTFVAKYYNSQGRCEQIHGSWSAGLGIGDGRCNIDERQRILLAAESCQALSRIEFDVGENCTRRITTSEKILQFLQKEYLAGLKAVLEEATDGRNQKQ